MSKSTHKLFDKKPADTPVNQVNPVNPAATNETNETPNAPNGATLAQRIVEYMARKGYSLARGRSEVNIVYIEGADADGRPNADRLDGWNDRRIVMVFEGGKPVIVHNAEATTEPGLAATNSVGAARRGGVARVQFGQFAVWQMGFHRFATEGPRHPALVQRRALKVHRDANRDGKRTGDALEWATGINQHGTRLGINPANVGTWSEGCLVGRSWLLHVEFIELCRRDPRYMADPNFFFPTTIIAGDDFARTV